jgi:hypothetical protein
MIYHDNCSVHKSNYTMTFLKEQSVQSIYGIPWVPELNCIESYLSVLKSLFRKMKLKSLVEGRQFDITASIIECIN